MGTHHKGWFEVAQKKTVQQKEFGGSLCPAVGHDKLEIHRIDCLKDIPFGHDRQSQ